MRKFVATAATVVLSLVLSATSARASTFDFASTIGASISFDGAGHFTFVDSSLSGPWNGYDFQITLGAPGFIGDFGNIGGTFTIGTVSSCGASCQTASVTGAGSLSMADGSGNTFAANLNWVDITTNGTLGGLNALGSVNLTNLSYSGSDPDYLSLLSAFQGIGTLTFQFVPARTLSQLATQAGTASYSGSVTAAPVPVPEPASVALLGTGLLGLAARYRRRARSKVRN